MPEPFPYLYLFASVVIYAYNMTYAHPWPFLFLTLLLLRQGLQIFYVACLTIDLSKQRGGLKWLAAQSCAVSLTYLMWPKTFLRRLSST